MSVNHADAPLAGSLGAEELAALGVLAARLSTGLTRLSSGLEGAGEDDALLRWLTGSAGPEDQRRLATVAKCGRLLLLTRVTTAVEGLVRCRHRDGLLLARLPHTALAVLVPGAPGPVGTDRALRKAQDLATEVARRDNGVAVAISGPLVDHLALHPALQDVRDALAVSPAGLSRPIRAEECWREIGVLRLARAAESLLPLPHPVQRLKAYDDSNRTDLARTLLLWLEEAGDGATVARRLHLHVNSVRYRVRRAYEVAGVSPDDATARLLMHVLLRGAYGDSLPLKEVGAHAGR